MNKTTALFLLGLLAAFVVNLRAEGGKVLAGFKPAEGAATTAIAWYNLSDAPEVIKSRDVAQTFRATADGEITQLVFPVEIAGNRSQANVGDFAFTVTFHDNGSMIPAARFITKNSQPQAAKAEMSTDGQNFIINLADPVPVIADQFYTFALTWEGPAPTNRISLQQSPGTTETFRWHRDNRGSWVKSPNSLQFHALGK